MNGGAIDKAVALLRQALSADPANPAIKNGTISNDPGCFGSYPANYGQPSAVDSRDVVANVHFGIPHRNDSGHDDVVRPLVGVLTLLAGEDPDRRPAGRLRTARCRGHHLAEAAADDRAPALGEQPPHLLGALLVLDAAPYDGYLHRGPGSLAAR